MPWTLGRVPISAHAYLYIHSACRCMMTIEWRGWVFKIYIYCTAIQTVKMEEYIASIPGVYDMTS